jgi:peptide-methionine (S)-S-oxide reductase
MKAAFAAGCFWGVEAKFKELGVGTTVGYMGGHTENPTYKEVCSGKTGHAETVLVEYNPKEVPYSKLLEAFWDMHDYTQVNRQGPNVGGQYRSVIFYFSEEQKKKAEDSMPKGATTEITEAGRFWPAEDYHQDYFEKHKVYGKICHTLGLE